MTLASQRSEPAQASTSRPRRAGTGRRGRSSVSCRAGPRLDAMARHGVRPRGTEPAIALKRRREAPHGAERQPRPHRGAVEGTSATSPDPDSRASDHAIPPGPGADEDDDRDDERQRPGPTSRPPAGAGAASRSAPAVQTSATAPRHAASPTTSVGLVTSAPADVSAAAGGWSARGPFRAWTESRGEGAHSSSCQS